MQREELFPNCNFVDVKPSYEEMKIAHRCFWIGKKCKNKKIDKLAGEKLV